MCEKPCYQSTDHTQANNSKNDRSNTHFSPLFIFEKLDNAVITNRGGSQLRLPSVILSAAKDLSRRAVYRSFAALRMTADLTFALPALVLAISAFISPALATS
jgi:hypothetical protein